MSTLTRSYKYLLLACLPALVPLTTHAAFTCSPGIRNLLCKLTDIVSLATGILAALALLVFFWGLVKYIVKADDEKAKEQGKNIMIWGVIALFVMFSVFGIVKFLQTSLGINAGNNTAPSIPKVLFTPQTP